MSPSAVSQKIAAQLSTAIKADDVKTLQALFSAHQFDINMRIYPDMRYQSGPTSGLLHIAVHANSHNVMKWLIRQNIDLETRTSFSWTDNSNALALAANLLGKGWPAEKVNESIDILLAAGSGPQAFLRECASAKNMTGVRRAIEAGADVNGDDGNIKGLKALHHAASNGDLAMMDYLIAQGADINTRHAALRLATLHDHPAAMRLLLRHGADPGMLDAKGMSLFFAAAETTKHTDEILDILLEQHTKLDPNLLNQCVPVESWTLGSTKTPLTRAIDNCPVEWFDPSTVPAFIRHGADWRELDKSGQSILHQLIDEQPLKAGLIKALLKTGIDPFIRNSKGVTAYEAAQHLDVIKKIFSNHCQPLHASVQHFNPATDPLLDVSGKPTALLQYACVANLLGEILKPSRWTCQEKALIATKQQLTAALPAPFAKQYDALLDVTALRRGSARKPASWLKRYVETPSSGAEHEL